mmetsp:Transcript_13001/g.31855  ORF Transcript_13001/g.31855 Transcript_13001/m.31855 type:complete len:643 (+) Transcript_13001:135-2063(+)|eukprot:CAMPEP_0114498624 /NCGR_PEP_ID=MMETSP0109-20121206/6973_1 /TAXON_ID=29199 /ORGANISM="Chlorarachnion reptans, Strain CCCM449" /LENGTH=642 /DNA_ID=CAMNT_0001676117 /DNA_START=30 /DNA_END=1958 /DNA_ORIENTATION=-
MVVRSSPPHLWMVASLLFAALIPGCYGDDFDYNDGFYDEIEEGKRRTPYALGRGKHFYSFTAFMSAFIVCMSLIFITMFVNRKDKKKLSNACNAIGFVSTAMFGLTSMMTVMSVYNGQGVKIEDWEALRTNDDKFMYDEYFTPSITTAMVSFGLIVANYLLQKFYFKGGEEQNPSKDVVVTQQQPKNSRYHELDYLKWYFIIGLVTFGHFNRMVEDDGTDTAIHIFGRSHWMIGFALITGYNSPGKYTDWIPRRSKRIFGYIFVYLWLQAMMILFVYYICIPMIKRRHGEDDPQRNDLIAQINPFCHFGEEVCNVEQLWFSDFLLYMLRVPGHALWYVKALFMWAVILPAWLNLRTPVFLAFLVWMGNKYFQMSGANNIVGMLSSAGAAEYWPWVVLGGVIKYYGYDKRMYKSMKTLPFILAGWGVIFLLLSFAVGAPFTLFHMGMFMPQHGSMASKAVDTQWWYMIGCFGWFMFTSTVCMSCVSIMPSFPSYFSRAGGNSFVAYLLHYFVLLLIWSNDFYNPMVYDHSPQSPMFLKATGLGAFTAIFLMHPQVAKYLIYLCNPPFLKWIFFNGEKKKLKGSKSAGAKSGKKSISTDRFQTIWQNSLNLLERLSIRATTERKSNVKILDEEEALLATKVRKM